MGYEDAEVSLPKTGITLVTGDNGVGKSCCFVEAPAIAFWGKTFRKTPPWKEGEVGSVKVLTDDVAVRRSKTPASSPSLQWMTEDQKSKHTTTTKGQNELEDIVGDWDTWRQTRILSTQEQEATYFTLATDKDRKRLIEGLLNIDIFDPALKKCRQERKDAEDKVAELNTECAVLAERVKVSRSNLTTIMKDLGEPPKGNIEELKEQHKKLKKKEEKLEKYIKECGKEKKTLHDERDDIIRKGSEASAKLTEATKHANRLGADNCPVCDQAITQVLKDSLKDNVDKAKKAAEKQKKTNTSRLQELSEGIIELSEERDALEKSLVNIMKKCEQVKQEAKAQKNASEEYNKRKNSVENMKASVEKNIKILEEKTIEQNKDQKELDELRAIEMVLGLEGVRAQIVGNALGGIEAVANKWLVQIASPDFQLELKPYSEQKNAKVKDKISLVIHGAGGGYGYKGSSGGERRRIDVALLFALAEVAAAARGAEKGDIIVDEIADSLDLAGRAAVAEALQELAKDKSVIVITHDVEFALLLQPKKRIHIIKENKVSRIDDSRQYVH